MSGETLAKAAIHDIEKPLAWCDKAVKVIETVTVEQPQLRTVLSALVVKVEAVSGDAVLVGVAEGRSPVADLKGIEDLKDLLQFVRVTLVPTVTKLYGEIKVDVATEPAAAAETAVPATQTATSTASQWPA